VADCEPLEFPPEKGTFPLPLPPISLSKKYIHIESVTPKDLSVCPSTVLSQIHLHAGSRENARSNMLMLKRKITVAAVRRQSAIKTK